MTHKRRSYYEKSNLHPQLDISSCKLYLCTLESTQLLKEKQKFLIFQNFRKIYANGHLTPTPKLRDVLTAGTKALKSNHISYTTVKPHGTTNIYKLGHDENQKQN